MPPGGPGGEDVCPPRNRQRRRSRHQSGAADQQKIFARPDQRPGGGNDRAAHADPAGIGTNRSLLAGRYVADASQQPWRAISAVRRCGGLLMLTLILTVPFV
jgi:hypothetical protein